MRAQLLAVGQKMPGWVEQGYREYADRLRGDFRLELREIPAVRRGRNDNVSRITEQEGGRLIAAIPQRAKIVALDLTGNAWSTEELAAQMRGWLNDGRDLALLVGGPDGLSNACLERAEQRWSLSALTFPHPLVRVIVAEQLYRAHSLLNNHPYHRAG